jgi:hypothetical protein
MKKLLFWVVLPMLGSALLARAMIFYFGAQ